ncbi:MAG: hypothetical protein FWC06_01305 [Treponema sp.]|nr:hypothetical protein [Treponema sp.]
MRKFLLLLFLIPVLAFAESMYSPTWGFILDLPAGYEFADGDGRDRFSFSGPENLIFDLVVYNARFNSIQDLITDVSNRISNKGDFDFFTYNGRQAAIMELTFSGYSGWGLVVELDSQDVSGRKPLLLALAYCPANRIDLDLLNLSALDSICPSPAERFYPGPVMEYSYPRGVQRNTPLAVRGLSALVYENDAEAAQALIEREFLIMQAYLDTPYLQDASIRYYRFIYRDSYDRIANAVSAIAYNFGGNFIITNEQKRMFAQRTLSFVQGFIYERDLNGSDFLNLVTAVTGGRGDCDSRAMLFAVILSHVNIRSAIMISHHYSHAMGLADIAGSGARFESYGTQWLVAETTANIDIGLIAQDQNDPRNWFAVLFE